MQERYEEWKNHLEGLREEMPSSFFCLARILECGAFELCTDKHSNDYFIPYMMNDALEYYLILKECRITGEYFPEVEVLSAEIIQDRARYVLILRQEAGNVCTLYFEDIEEHAQCYQYHRIGHFWVKGQEHWRQLVYKIGTIYDKYEYFGERFCNEKEQEIRDLILFAPFQYWSPIHESLEDRYPASPEGLAVMERLAQEAGDREYLRLLKIYKVFSISFVKRWMAKKLLSPKRQKLYELIYRKVGAASLEYPERDYGPEGNARIVQERQRIDRELREKGFEGTYPEYIRGKEKVIAMEEHPFTIMESEDFEFRIQLMKTDYVA